MRWGGSDTAALFSYNELIESAAGHLSIRKKDIGLQELRRNPTSIFVFWDILSCPIA
jgi:hypothetical protein